MTPKQKSECEKAWEIFKETDEPVGQAKLYYKDNGEYFKKGYQAALQSEGVKKLVEALKDIGMCKSYTMLNDPKYLVKVAIKALTEWELPEAGVE